MATNHIPLDTTKAAARDLKSMRDTLFAAVTRLEEQRAVLLAMKDVEDYTEFVANGIGQTVEDASSAFYQIDVVYTAFNTAPLKDQLGQLLSFLGGN
jgi:hypothetical protein